MAFQKVKILFDEEDQKKCKSGVWALYSTYFDVAAVSDEDVIDNLLEKDDEEIAEVFAELTYPG